MNKVLSVAVLLALSTASDDFSDNSLNVFSKIKDDLKKAGHFVAEHPQIITTAAKILARDDEFADTELNFKDFVHKVEGGVQKTAGFVADHPELVSTIAKIIAKKDDEITDDELSFLSKVKEDLKKAGNFVAEHPQIITTGAKIATKLIKHDDEELFKIPKPKVDIGVHFDEAADAELNAKDVLKKVGSGLLTGAKIASKFLDDEVAEDELLINSYSSYDPLTVTVPSYGGAPASTYQSYTGPTIIHRRYDDNELNAKDVFKKIGSGLLTGAKIASKFLNDEAADEELFKIPKPQLDVKVHFDDEELFAHAHRNQTQQHEAVKKTQRDVKHASEILRKLHNIHHQRNGTHHDSLSNLGQLLHEGRQIHHKNATQVHDHNLSIKDKLKKAFNWVGDHPQVISEAAKAAQILKGKK